MNIEERVRLIKAMEYIARQINDEDIFMSWLENGVADGDIEYGDLRYDPLDEDMKYYAGDDGNFADVINTFMSVMSRARASGGLYCDGVCAGERRLAAWPMDSSNVTST